MARLRWIRPWRKASLSGMGRIFSPPRVTLTGLTGGGKLTMTIHNAPKHGPTGNPQNLRRRKVSGISFLVEHFISGSGYQLLGTYTTDGSGKISIPGLSVGTTLRVTETVPPELHGGEENADYYHSRRNQHHDLCESLHAGGSGNSQNLSGREGGRNHLYCHGFQGECSGLRGNGQGWAADSAGVDQGSGVYGRGNRAGRVCLRQSQADRYHLCGDQYRHL